jgi:hypothetical protein
MTKAQIDDKDILIPELFDFIFDGEDHVFIGSNKVAGGVNDIPTVFTIDSDGLYFEVVSSSEIDKSCVISELIKRFSGFEEIQAVVTTDHITLYHV